jgi:hypothetical protein
LEEFLQQRERLPVADYLIQLTPSAILRKPSMVRVLELRVGVYDALLELSKRMSAVTSDIDNALFFNGPAI